MGRAHLETELSGGCRMRKSPSGQAEVLKMRPEAEVLGARATASPPSPHTQHKALKERSCHHHFQGETFLHHVARRAQVQDKGLSVLQELHPTFSDLIRSSDDPHLGGTSGICAGLLDPTLSSSSCALDLQKCRRNSRRDDGFYSTSLRYF